MIWFDFTWHCLAASYPIIVFVGTHESLYFSTTSWPIWRLIRMICLDSIHPFIMIMSRWLLSSRERESLIIKTNQKNPNIKTLFVRFFSGYHLFILISKFWRKKKFFNLKTLCMHSIGIAYLFFSLTSGNLYEVTHGNFTGDNKNISAICKQLRE